MNVSLKNKSIWGFNLDFCDISRLVKNYYQQAGKFLLKHTSNLYKYKQLLQLG